MCMGCGASLTAPTNLEIDQDTLELTWSKIEEAKYYTLDINGEEVDSTKASYKLEKLDPGDYTIKVKAIGDGNSYSDWSQSIPFTRETETGMLFRLINKGTEYEVSNVGTAEGDIVVPETYRGRKVTSIGKKAFAKKQKIFSVTLSDNITNIGEQAFMQCEALKTINIPSTVVSIGRKAFQSCSSLESDIVIPEGVTAIEEGTFGYCPKIKNITISSNVEVIGESAFTDCSSLEKIIIPDSVKQIGGYAFSACVAATELSLGEGVELIGECAFQQCKALTEISVNEGVVVIYDKAFEECTEVVKVTIPDTVVYVGGEAFKGCTKLATVELSNNLQTLGYNAFKDTVIWTQADNMVYVDGWLVDSKVKDAAEYEIADGTVGIGVQAMAYCKTVSSIIIPNSVKLINDAAFAVMENLASVVIGEGVEELSSQAFTYCGKLTNVILGGYDFGTQKMTGSSLKKIGQRAFYGCTLLASIEIPETVENIGSYAFRKTAIFDAANTGVVYAGNWAVDWNQNTIILQGGNIAIKDGTVGIAEYAFFQCMFVSELTVPETVKYINRAAFYQMVYALKVQLPSTLTRIEEYTFYQCQQLMDVNLPETLEYIGPAAFAKCMMLGCAVDITGTTIVDREYTLVIPDAVKTIGNYAFYESGIVDTNPETGITTLYGVDKVVLGAGLEEIGINAFGKFATLKEVETGNGLKVVGEKAFYKCPNLEKVTFGSSIEKVDTRAFYGCTNLQEIILPDSVRELAAYAFYKCENVKTVKLNEGLQAIGNYAFTGLKKVETLYIPASVQSIGKQAFRNWKALQSVVVCDGVQEVVNHAFYGCSVATVYVESATQPTGWGERWNSSYRPVAFGVTIADEGYVVSFTKTADTLKNVNAKTFMQAPARAGYVFVGWAATADAKTAQWQANEVENVADGTVLYAVWQQGAPQETPAQ